MRVLTRHCPWLLVLLVGLLVPACLTDDEVYVRMLCDPLPDSVEPAEGSPNGGYEVVISGRFVSSAYEGFATNDLVVRFGGYDAEVVAVDADGCDPCFACLETAGFCVECTDVCDGNDPHEDETDTCVETVTVVVPPHEPGDVSVSLFNGHGSTAEFGFTYLDWCSDGEDNDGDDLADADDPGCTGSGGASEAGPCEDHADNDGDSWIDEQDPGCAGDPAGPTEVLAHDSECNNGLDDDGDDLTDAADPDCEDGYDTSETP